MTRTTLCAIGTLFFACVSANLNAALIINEVDYDQPGADQAEFVELYNANSQTINLGDFTLSLINGSTNKPYRTIELPDQQLTGYGYFLICGDGGLVINCDLPTSHNSRGLIQNGAPDAIALYHGGELIDSLSYEGSVTGFSEGSGKGLFDLGAYDYLGLSRLFNGLDNDISHPGFRQACITPGSANDTTRATDCTPPALTAVPLPGSLLLLISGLVFMPWFKLRSADSSTSH